MFLEKQDLGILTDDVVEGDEAETEMGLECQSLAVLANKTSQLQTPQLS
jgi:hypothetical protein